MIGVSGAYMPVAAKKIDCNVELIALPHDWQAVHDEKAILARELAAYLMTRELEYVRIYVGNALPKRLRSCPMLRLVR